MLCVGQLRSLFSLPLNTSHSSRGEGSRAEERRGELEERGAEQRRGEERRGEERRARQAATIAKPLPRSEKHKHVCAQEEGMRQERRSQEFRNDEMLRGNYYHTHSGNQKRMTWWCH